MHCHKYHGLGNDFLLFDQPMELPNPDFIQKICHRRFGLGADGVIFLEKEKKDHSRMHFFNCDGVRASFCANATRVSFFHLNKKKAFIRTDAALLQGFLEENIVHVKTPKAKLLNAGQVFEGQKVVLVCCGVKHGLVFVDEISHDLIGAKALRDQLNSNISFVKKIGYSVFEMLTYEIGVEGFTYACGSACASLAFYLFGQDHDNSITVKMKGGTLNLYQDRANDLWMKGQVKRIATIHIDENF